MGQTAVRETSLESTPKSGQPLFSVMTISWPRELTTKSKGLTEIWNRLLSPSPGGLEHIFQRVILVAGYKPEAGADGSMNPRVEWKETITDRKFKI